MNKTINQKQLEAIEAELKPCFVLSGAGTGKTFVLIKRIVHLINKKNILPSRIWAVTFTNKASEEIKERIKNECGYLLNYVATFHKSCVWILRKHIHLIGRNNNFKIIDDNDQNILIRRIVKNLNKDFDTSIKSGKFLSWIKAFKNNDYKSHEVSLKLFIEIAGENYACEYKFFVAIFNAYQNYLKTENLIDFDEILIFAEQVLKFEESINYWQNYFDAVLIDEFQDTNDIQFRIFSIIAAKHRNIFVVGDPDQSIYAWRGAKPEIIKEFINKYPEAKLILLEQNYRSTQKILNVANLLIQNNKDRIDKKLYTKKAMGELTTAFMGKDGREEANWICEEIKKLKIENSQLKFSDITILYRNNYLTKQIEEALIDYGFKYTIWNGAKFYQRVEIRTMIAYLNLCLSNDALSIEKVYNIPKRNITEKTYEKLHYFAQNQKKELIEAFKLADKINGISNKAILGCYQFYELIKKIQKLDKNDVAKLIQELFVITGYKNSLDPKLDKFRFENIDAFVNSIAQMQKNDSDKTLENILDEIALFLVIDEDNNNDNDRINLMTIHGAKGLEFEYVFVSNMTEGVFPSSKSFYSFEAIEEERRLAYVAFTRAINRLYLSGCRNYNFNLKTFCDKSRFLKEAEMCDDVIQKKQQFTAIQNWKNVDGYFDSQSKNQNQEIDLKTAQNIETKFHVGSILVHELFGPGRVIEMGNLGNIKILKIKFDKYQNTKDIIATSKKLRYLKS